MKDIVSKWHGFGNDVLLKFSQRSEFDVAALRQGVSSIEAYKEDQKFNGTLDEFIERYGLHFEYWLMQQNLDLFGIDEILIDVCW